IDEPLSFPGLRAGLVDLEYSQTGSELRSTLCESIQSGSEYDVLIDTAVSLFRNQIFDEAGSGHNGSSERAREHAHILTVTPSLFRRGQAQADHVFEHVGRRIGFYVKRPP